MTRLPPRPDLEWTPEGAPRSARFGDVYYSRAGGLEEAETVFLQGCGLPEAWGGRACFTLVELGFGTGLNALATWRLWARTRSPGALLHFITMEAFPLDVEDADRALKAFPELAPYWRSLHEAWPVRTKAAQRIWFDEDGFVLTALQQSAEEALAGLACKADAWFLDGFSPRRNPEMWRGELMALIAARSAAGARLATYSVSGQVRRALEAAGFATEKKPGFGTKRERLEARLIRAPAPIEQLFPAGPASGRVAIVGGGAAGGTLAHALRRRGRECVLYEAEELGAGASGAPAGLVMPRLDRGGDVAEMHLAAFIYAVRLYEKLGVFDRCGILERPGVRDAEALADLLADPPLPPDWLCTQGDGALHVRAGVVRAREAIAALTEGSDVRIARVAAIEREGASWLLRDASGQAFDTIDAVVLAVGAGLKRFEQCDWLPLRLSRGQSEWAPGGRLQAAISARSHAAPLNGGILFGATFDEVENDNPPMPDEHSRTRNLAALQTLAPALWREIHGKQMVSRVSLRAALPDYAPVLGLMPDSELWRAQNAQIAFGRTPPVLEAPSLRGFYLFGGLGARGLTLAPLLAENLASEICGEPPLLSRRGLSAIHPARFLLRALKKREGISD